MEIVATAKGTSLHDLLVESSVDAFILSLETINRISVRHRVQSFLFTLCNAWELLMKARMIEINGGNEAIYYNDQGSNQKLRTKALRDCIRELYKENDPIRRNLWRVGDLRDESIHLIMGEIPKEILALLQACVINYHKALEDWFEKSLYDTVPLGMMTIVFDMSPERFDLKNASLRQRLDISAIVYLEELQADIRKERIELGDALEYSVVFDYKLALIKSNKEAEITLTNGSDGKALLVVDRPKDAARTHPYRMKELVGEIKSRSAGACCLSPNDIAAIKFAHNIEKREEYFFQLAIPNSQKQYSDAL